MKRFNLLLVAAMVSLVASAFKADLFSYEILSEADRTVSVNGWSGEGEMVVPATVDYEGETYKVVAISDNPYPASGNGTFGNYTSKNLKMTGVSFEANADGTYNIEYIGRRAFFCYDKIKSVSLPASLKKIGKQAFQRCRMTKLVIDCPELVVDTAAFCQCKVVEEVRVKNVKHIGEHAFSELGDGLSVSKLVVEQGCQDFTCDYNVFGNGSKLTIVEFYARRIPADFFGGRIHTVVLGKNVEEIGKRAFAKDQFLEDLIVLGTKVPACEAKAFYYAGCNVSKSKVGYPAQYYITDAEGNQVVNKQAYETYRVGNRITARVFLAAAGSDLAGRGLSVAELCNSAEYLALRDKFVGDQTSGDAYGWNNFLLTSTGSGSCLIYLAATDALRMKWQDMGIIEEETISMPELRTNCVSATRLDEVADEMCVVASSKISWVASDKDGLSAKSRVVVYGKNSDGSVNMNDRKVMTDFLEFNDAEIVFGMNRYAYYRIETIYGDDETDVYGSEVAPLIYDVPEFTARITGVRSVGGTDVLNGVYNNEVSYEVTDNADGAYLDAVASVKIDVTDCTGGKVGNSHDFIVSIDEVDGNVACGVMELCADNFTCLASNIALNIKYVATPVVRCYEPSAPILVEESTGDVLGAAADGSDLADAYGESAVSYYSLNGAYLGVESVDAAIDGETEYFTIAGVKVAASDLAPGIYVARTNGVSKKVVIK